MKSEPSPRVPSYRRHKGSGQAVVTLNGREIYLGKWNTAASRREYNRLVGEWLASDGTLGQQHDLSVVELIAAYRRFAQRHYVKNGKATSEQHAITSALRFLRKTYGRTLAANFGPLALKAIRQQMIDAGWCRTTINANVGRIRRMFRWAIAEELVPPTVYQALAAVDGIRAGRTEAKESDPVLPVDDAVVEESLRFLSPVVSDMVRFQRLTGCRPAEVCRIRPCDIDSSGATWAYRPESHKTEHHDRQRVIFIGPKAQDVLRPYLLRAADSYCFTPVDSERKRREDQHAARRTPLGYGNRPGTKRRACPRWKPGKCYDTAAYRRAVTRAVARANARRRKVAATAGEKFTLMPHWSPNQLRHTTATDLRRWFGLEAAQVVLGHSMADVTQVYAQRDMTLAAKIMREVG